MKHIVLVVLLFTMALVVTACADKEEKHPLAVAACTKKPKVTALCTVFKAIEKGNPSREYRDVFVQDATAPTLNCDTAGLCTITKLKAGFRSIPTPPAPKHHDSLRYIDFNTNKFLEISDQEAMENNVDWTVGIRDWVFFTNGGIFPGQIGIAMVKGNGAAFTSFNLAKAKALDDDDFIQENPIDTSACRQFKFQPPGTIPTTPTAGNFLNVNMKPYMMYNYDTDNHTPLATEDRFYVLKDCSKPGWFAKVRVDKIEYNPTENYDMFDLRYQVLK